MSKRNTELIRVDSDFAELTRKWSKAFEDVRRNLNQEIPRLHPLKNLRRPVSIPWITRKMAQKLPSAEDVISRELRRCRHD